MQSEYIGKDKYAKLKCDIANVLIENGITANIVLHLFCDFIAHEAARSTNYIEFRKLINETIDEMVVEHAK